MTTLQHLLNRGNAAEASGSPIVPNWPQVRGALLLVDRAYRLDAVTLTTVSTHQRRGRSLRSLYCCSDSVRGRGAAVTNLSHSASFHSDEWIAPSNLGIKQITAADAEEISRRDLQKFERAVASMVRVPLNQNQFDALVSLAFNIEPGSLQKSTLLRRLKASDYQGAADQFLVWNKSNGRTPQVLFGGGNPNGRFS